MPTAEIPAFLPTVGGPTACLTTPLTQKARGIVALSQFDKESGVPTFNIYPASKVHPGQLVGYFARPCPMRPRHGFVDSRVVSTVEEGVTLIHETLSADPEAEIVTMPHVAAQFSGIWTPGLLVIGRGTDGATSGSSAFSIPALGDLTNNDANLKSAAGIQGTPYLELLWPTVDSLPLKVQLRDGPPLPQSLDYIPKPTCVSEIVRAEGDLLTWETKMRSVAPGAVVYHPGGSLASHYAIHAVLNQVPMLISREPAIGEELKPDEASDVANEIDLEALRAGFHFALRTKISQSTAALIMLAGCHHIVAWKGKLDRSLGLALGFGFRLAVTAALGEIRHVGREGHRIDRDVLYCGCWNKTYHGRTRARFRRALDEFLDGDLWSSGYGGRRWFEFTRWAAVIHNRMAISDGLGSLEALNQLVHGVHNGGWGFNKFLSEHLLDQTANNPVRTLVECAPTLYRIAEPIQSRKGELARAQMQMNAPIKFLQDFDVHEVCDDGRESSRRSEW